MRRDPDSHRTPSNHQQRSELQGDIQKPHLHHQIQYYNMDKFQAFGKNFKSDYTRGTLRISRN